MMWTWFKIDTLLMGSMGCVGHIIVLGQVSLAYFTSHPILPSSLPPSQSIAEESGDKKQSSWPSNVRDDDADSLALRTSVIHE